MDRREFLKTALTFAALAPFARFSAKAESAGAESGGTQLTRRPYRNTGKTLPLLGYGGMRFPTKDGRIDREKAQALIDKAMASGVNYFDTAYMYHGGDSETFLGEALAKYPRESYFITSKMPLAMMKMEADNERIFNEQLARTKAGYFDFYLLHWLSGAHWEKAQRLKTLEFVKRMKAEGKIKHIGFSYHGDPDTLQRIAEAYPWELVLIQLNYLDWDLTAAGKQYDILTKLGIPVAIMEPLKGGALANLPADVRAVYQNVNPDVSLASWAFRYCGSLPNVQVVLSGMTRMEHLEENIKTFSNFKPLTDAERRVIDAAVGVYRKTGAVPCTGCNYCAPCPVGVDISRNLLLFNQMKGGLGMFQARITYESMTEDERASACVNCGACRKKCPQGIDIPKLLQEIAAKFN